MKTVLMDRDFDYHPSPQVTIWYKAGKRYERVPEAAVATIEAAGAGKATGEMEPALISRSCQYAHLRTE